MSSSSSSKIPSLAWAPPAARIHQGGKNSFEALLVTEEYIVPTQSSLCVKPVNVLIHTLNDHHHHHNSGPQLQRSRELQ